MVCPEFGAVRLLDSRCRRGLMPSLGHRRCKVVGGQPDYRGVGNLFTLLRKLFFGWSPIAASANSDDTFAASHITCAVESPRAQAPKRSECCSQKLEQRIWAFLQAQASTLRLYMNSIITGAQGRD